MVQSTEVQLADRGQRLGAYLIDGLIQLPLAIPLIFLTGASDYLSQRQPVPTSIKAIIISCAFVLFVLIHGYFLNKYGQTIGKRLLRIRITDEKNNVPKLWKLIILRHLPFSVAYLVPFIGQLIVLTDPLLIFRKNRRCLHDYLAGTKVVKVN
jgi:uncharacterized RDD family membrane protein YckC